MNTRLIVPALLGALLLGAPVASAARMSHEGWTEHQLDKAAVRDFNVTGKETVPIAELQKPETYRVCLRHHEREVMILHDKDQTSLHGGQCVDVEGQNIYVRGTQDGMMANGYYEERHDHHARRQG